MSIKVKTAAELEIMREGGRRLVQILRCLKKQIVPGVSLKTLDQIARDEAKKQGGRPAFLGYRGYPAAICASVNEGVVHCIPTEYQLQTGDLVSIDFGFYYQGWYTDAAITWIVEKDINNYLPLLRGVYQALRAGVAQVRAGVRVGEVSRAIESTLSEAHLTTMRQFAGHGVGKELHEDPVVSNFVGHDKNVILPAGSTISVEPIAGVGGEEYTTAADNWSVRTTDKKPVAHFEETVAVVQGGAEILTPIQEILDFTP